MQLTSLGDLYRDLLAQNLPYTFRKRLTRITAVTQQAMNMGQVRLASFQRLQSAFAISHFCGGDRHAVGQPLRINSNMSLDPRYFFACVVPFRGGRISVLDALRVHDQERAAYAALLSRADLANLIFLKPAPAG